MPPVFVVIVFCADLALPDIGGDFFFGLRRGLTVVLPVVVQEADPVAAFAAHPAAHAGGCFAHDACPP